MSLELIPARWLDYDPPGLCHWAAAGVIASVVGTGISALSSMQESSYKSAVARNQAIVDQQKANEEAAIGQRAMITQNRKTELVQSRARALAASSGTDAASPTQVTIEQNIAQQGGYNALSALYEGMAKSQASDYQAELNLFKAKRTDAATPLLAGGQLLSGVSKLADSRSLLKLFSD